MKLRLAVRLALILFSVALALQSRPQSNISADEGRVLALETVWNRAEQSKEAAALDQLLSPQFVSTDYDGGISNKQEFLASIKRDGLVPEQITNEEQTAHVFGDCAVVTGIYREKGVDKGTSYSRPGRFTDTWVKTNGSWHCVASQSTLIER